MAGVGACLRWRVLSACQQLLLPSPGTVICLCLQHHNSHTAVISGASELGSPVSPEGVHSMF
jgi:hypothetical protein